MSDPLGELFTRIEGIYREYYPKDVSCIGRIATEFISFKREFDQKFMIVSKGNKEEAGD